MSKILKDTKVSIVQVPLTIVVALASILFLPPLSSSVQAPIVNKTDATVTPPEPNYSRGFDLIENQQYKAAERYWREIYQKSLGEPTQQAIALQQVAKAQWATRRFKVAMNSLDLAIKKLLNGGDKSLLVAVYYQIATLQIQSDLLKEAEENLQKSMKLVASDRDDLSNIGIDKPDLKNLDLKNLDLNNLDLNNLDLNNLDLNNNVSAISLIKNRLGQIFALQDNHQKALQVFTESYEGFIAIDDRPAALISARNAIKSAVKLQSYALAIDLYSQALLVAETESTSLAPPSIPSLTMMPSLNASQSITTTKIALISVLGNFPKSELEALSIKYLHAVLLLKNMTEAQDINNYNVSYALSVLASLYFRAGETEQALLISNKAILHSQALGPNKLLVRNLMLSGAIYRLQGDRQHALQAYRLAVKEYNSQRTQDISALAGYANTQSLDDIVIDAESLYLSLADLILVNARAEKNQRIVQALLIEARDTIELKKVTELQNYFKNSCDVSRAASKMKIDEIIQSGSAAIYPILLPDRL
ncbi:MAG: tetratricopeptide repeat protein, partial [Thiohalomonadales bacterium]